METKLNTISNFDLWSRAILWPIYSKKSLFCSYGLLQTNTTLISIHVFLYFLIHQFIIISFIFNSAFLMVLNLSF